ncbi:RNA polymerase sigma factor [Streptomyces sp. NPDC058467]|uniref:RNA polymerase sigma factor n=1 Tax=Streptomyces sp. NPDC058467 TaxID=3346513 RepID=UPI00365C2242
MDRIETKPLSAASAARLDRLFRLYGTRLLAYARTQTRDADAAQDVAAETWIRAGRGLHNLRNDDDGAFAWLRVIAQHAATSYYSGYERPEDWTDAVASRALPAAASAEDVALAEPSAPADVDPELVAALDALPEQDRTVVCLRSEGLTWEAVGQSYGRTCGTAYRRYHRVLQTLRADLPALAG